MKDICSPGMVKVRLRKEIVSPPNMRIIRDRNHVIRVPVVQEKIGAVRYGSIIWYRRW